VSGIHAAKAKPQFFLRATPHALDKIDPINQFKLNSGADAHGYTKVDLHVGVGPTDGRWESGVIAKNLGNVRAAGLRTGAPASAGLGNAFPERDRSVALQFTIKR